MVRNYDHPSLLLSFSHLPPEASPALLWPLGSGQLSNPTWAVNPQARLRMPHWHPPSPHRSSLHFFTQHICSEHLLSGKRHTGREQWQGIPQVCAPWKQFWLQSQTLKKRKTDPALTWHRKAQPAKPLGRKEIALWWTCHITSKLQTICKHL